MYLFIGGPWDGKRVETDNRMNEVFIPNGQDEEGKFKRMRYQQFALKISPDAISTYVYVADDGDPRNVIERLVDRYVGA